MTALLQAGISGWNGGLAFPDAATTGPAAGGYSGLTPVTLSTATSLNSTGYPSWATASGGGLLVSEVAFTIAATLTVNADVVTFQGCTFNWTASGSPDPTVTLDGTGLYVFQYCTFYSDSAVTRMDQAINQNASAALTIQYCDISGMRQAVQIIGGSTAAVTIANNYFHDMAYYQGDHSEPIYAGPSGGGSNITITGNTLLNSLNQTACVYIHPMSGYVFSDITISGNFLAGGGYTLYCANTAATNFTVASNVFSTVYYANCGFDGTGYTSNPPPFNVSGGNVWSGNTWYDGRDAGATVSAP